uniref:Uncharacterized protein n=1 Tax=Romanomermis culicivorax TaxID=13658 RepID=A0A915JQQ8_ROMCU
MGVLANYDYLCFVFYVALALHLRAERRLRKRALFAGLHMRSNFTDPCLSRPAFETVVPLPWEREFSGDEPEITDLIKDKIERPSNRSRTIPPLIQVCVTLRYLSFRIYMKSNKKRSLHIFTNFGVAVYY